MTFEIGDIIEWVWNGGRDSMSPQLLLGDGINNKHYRTLDLSTGEISDSDWLKKYREGYWRKVA